MGLGKILNDGAGDSVHASYGRMRPSSAGKDSTSGHWELAGVVLQEPFAVYEKFPPELVSAIESESGIRFLGNCAASGTEIIRELGGEHLRTQRPILYTSADSVLQIAAHEGALPIERLYDICRVARRHADNYRIGRVIARPFVGDPDNFTRTQRRHDFAMPPPRTVLNSIAESGLPVAAIGKTSDLFNGSGITESYSTSSNADGMCRIDFIWRMFDTGLVFANLVDFDSAYGHRRDVKGFAKALEEFDAWLGSFLRRCAKEDLVIITADHGNDPTFKGTDHTREDVPLMVWHGGLSNELGSRDTFADVASALAAFFGLQPEWPAKCYESQNQVASSSSSLAGGRGLPGMA
jgi:phosphopentomutase